MCWKTPCGQILSCRTTAEEVYNACGFRKEHAADTISQRLTAMEEHYKTKLPSAFKKRVADLVFALMNGKELLTKWKSQAERLTTATYDNIIDAKLGLATNPTLIITDSDVIAA